MRKKPFGVPGPAEWLGMFVVIVLACVTVAEDMAREKEMKQLRKQAAHRCRRIIMNNDGNDCRCPKPEVGEMREVFLRQRTSPLVGSQVDAISYCTGVFNSYTHHSEETEVRGYGDRFAKDWGWELGQHGPDSLATMVDFGHQHGMEVFWSMRMNDTHDSADEALLCRWKKDHPEYLMASKGDKLPYGSGRWSAVDYGIPEVREKVFRILADVCARYDVDGIEMDFFRHPVYFKPQCYGEPVTQEHCDRMTGLIQRVRRMTEEVSLKRGRPLLIAVRVPDSVGYSAGIGLDVERWLKEDLVDILVVSGYFHLTPWEDSVRLGHKYDVSVYPCLSESRIRGGAEKERKSLASYRARAMNVWNSGADGVYTFNAFNPKHAMWWELGDPRALERLDKVYFACVRSPRAAGRWLAGGERFNTLPGLSPEQPVKLTPGAVVTILLPVGENLSGGKEEGIVPELTLKSQVDKLSGPEALSVAVNGNALSNGKLAGGLIEYKVRPDQVVRGQNQFDLSIRPGPDAMIVLKDLFLWVQYRPKQP